MNYKTTLFMLNQIRKLSTSKFLNARKNHYNSLGLAKTATQADVKGAYYELSKVYHPDKNQGTTTEQREQHSQKFRDITEAYEVLGNVKLRRMYDKGFLGDSPQTTRTSQDDPLHKFYKSRETRNRAPPPGGKTPIYDFDEWSKQHYGEAFRRGQEMRTRHAFHNRANKQEKESLKQDALMWSIVFFVGFCMCVEAIRTSNVVIHLFGVNVKESTKDID